MTLIKKVEGQQNTSLPYVNIEPAVYQHLNVL